MAQSYDVIGVGYAARRRADPRIEAQVWAALGAAPSVVNVGAGAGSYEPHDRFVLAIEPSRTQIDQRASDAAPVVRAVAEALPLPDASFEAGLAVLTLHHWTDWRAGIAELRRVVRGRIVVLTHEIETMADYWLTRDYFPGIAEYDRPRFPRPEEIAAALGGATIEAVPVPADCTDGFLLAAWRRPERYLDGGVRSATSGFLLLPPEELAAGLGRLEADLASGEWGRRNAALLELATFDGGYRLIVAGREG